MSTGADVGEKAREWIGTPYRHQHTTKGAGCDCLGLVRGVYREVVGDEPELPPNYSPSWGEGDRIEVLMTAAGRHLVPVEEWSADDLMIGDVLIFRMQRGMIAKHCGIVSSGTHMIHAYQGAENVIESALVPYWRTRIVGVFRYPGVE